MKQNTYFQMKLITTLGARQVSKSKTMGTLRNGNFLVHYTCPSDVELQVFVLANTNIEHSKQRLEISVRPKEFSLYHATMARHHITVLDFE